MSLGGHGCKLQLDMFAEAYNREAVILLLSVFLVLLCFLAGVGLSVLNPDDYISV